MVSPNPGNIYENLKMLINSPELIKELGLKSRKYVEEVHDTRHTSRELKKLYESLYRA